MINSKSKKNVLIIRGSETLENPLLLFGKKMMILSNNSNGNKKRTDTYAKYRDGERSVTFPPLPIAIPNSHVCVFNTWERYEKSLAYQNTIENHNT